MCFSFSEVEKGDYTFEKPTIDLYGLVLLRIIPRFLEILKPMPHEMM
jgi:hypothetical protein